MVVKETYGTSVLSRVLKDNSRRNQKSGKKKDPVHVSIVLQLFRYSNLFDKFLMVLGTIASLGNGIMLPFTSFIFGDLTSAFITQKKYAQDLRYMNNTDLSAESIFIAYGREIPTGHDANRSIPDDFINEKVFLEITAHYGLIYVLIGTIVFALSFVQTACWETACRNLINKLRHIYFAQALRQDISWYDEKEKEDLTNIITDDIEKMRAGLGSKVPVFLQSVSLLCSGIAVGFFTNWRLTLVIMIGAPVMVIAATHVGKEGFADAAREQVRYGIAGGIVSAALSSIRTISAFGGEKWELNRFIEAVIEGKNLTVKKYHLFSASMALASGFIYLLYGVGLWYSSELFLNGLLVPGQLFIVFMSVVAGALGIGNSLPNVIEISTAIGSAAVILKMIDNIPKIDPYSKEGLTIQNMRGDIEFKNVHFSYLTRPHIMVLRGMNMVIPAGRVVAVVGSSGVGKSTVVSLILRFYDPIDGEVFIDGNNIADLNVQNFRNQIGVVSQEPVLFDVTIGENIRYGKPDATKEEIEEAAKIAYAHSFIESFPKGYDTLVGERGVQLSGGQKQRIAIARAIVRKPKILLLDEATSALDSHSESIFQAALDNASKGRTTIIIAHRLSTIRNADIIYAMKDGQVTEYGQHSELMEKKGIYYKLVLAQSEKSVEITKPTKIETIVKYPVENGEEEFKNRKNLSSITKHSKKCSSSSNEDHNNINYFKLLFQLTGSPCKLIIIAVSCLIIGCHLPTFAVLYGGIVGLFVLPDDEFKNQVIISCVMFGILAFVVTAATGTATLTASYVTEDMIKELRIKTFKNLLSQQVSFFDQESYSPIRLTNTLAKEPPSVKSMAGLRAGYILVTVVTTVLSLAIAFYCGWRIALIVLCFVPFVVYGNWIQMRMSFQTYVQEGETTQRVAKIAAECFQNITTVQFLCLQEHMLSVFTDELKKSHSDKKKQSLIFSFTYALVNATVYPMYGCTFKFGSALVASGNMTGEEIFRTLYALVFGSTTLGNTAIFFQDFGKAKVAITQVVKLMTTPSTLPMTEQGEKPEIHGNIQFKDIVFSYPTRTHIPVLKDFNLKIPQGKTVALVGGSGCGKSTVISLLERFYNPVKGHIFIDGMNIENINVSYLRSQIGLVTQEPTLFDSSIRDNIAYGISSLGRKVTEQEIIDAAKAANIHEFITSLPQGYETPVGKQSSKLSGGQKQRVAIARALLRKPKILLLDEATSALDIESEKVVQGALDNARQGRTSIVIAHRLCTVQSADLIAVIAEGRVTELGTHSQLLELRGHYYNLVKSQYHS